MKKSVLLFNIFFWLSLFNVIHAQTPQIFTPATDTVKLVDIIQADRIRFIRPDSTNQLTIAVGNVVFRDNNTMFYADSVVHNKKLQTVQAFGNVHINDSDSIHTYSQYLIYHADKKLAELRKKVRMTDGKATLTTDELDYDTQLRLGTYRNGGKVVNGKSVLTSKEATYYADLHDVYFKKNVKLLDPAYNLTSDSLLYNTDSQVATFISKTFIEDSSKTNIVTSEGYYDMKNRMAKFGRRAVIKDKALTVTGNNIAIDDVTGQFEAVGNAVLIDTSQGISVIANNIKADRRTNSFLATLHPLMILKQDKDSLYITADTLFSGMLSDLPDSIRRKNKDSLSSPTTTNSNDTANSNRYFQAFHHVRIFSDSLQAVSDSLYYSGRDSVFQLFHDPIFWASNSQVTGDTIYLYTKNKKPERLYVFENGMVINRSSSKLYNQMKGNTLNGYFKDGNIENMRAKGSAESVYYAQDENQAYVGMNNASADIIDMYFLNKELNKVVYRNEINGGFFPIRQIPEDKKTLRNFKWQDDRRPKTRFELFEDIVTNE